MRPPDLIPDIVMVPVEDACTDGRDYSEVAETRAEARGYGLNADDDYADWWMADER